MESIGEDFEVVIVDDGSIDSTLEKLEDCHGRDKRFKILTLSRNFGHQAAYTAGLNYAKGDFIAMMDGDLQDPPELIKEMYQKASGEEIDIVYGRRKERKEKLSKRLFIRLFHFIFSRLSKLENIKQVGNFSLMSKRALGCIFIITGKKPVSARTEVFYRF